MDLQKILEQLNEKILAKVSGSDTLSFEFDKEKLFEGVDLPDETKTVIVEALELYAIQGVNQVAKEIAEVVVNEMESEFNLLEEILVQETKTKVLENFDYAINKSTNEWQDENEEALSNKFKAGLYESMLDGVIGLAINNNIDLSDEKIDMYDKVVEQEQDARKIANDLSAENKMLMEQVDELTRANIMSELTEGMADTKKEEFVAVLESIKTDSLYEKGTSLKTVFNAKSVTKKTTDPVIITEAEEARRSEAEKAKAPKTKKTNDSEKRVVL